MYADITWVGFTGREIPADVTRAFDTIVRRVTRRSPSPSARCAPATTSAAGRWIARRGRCCEGAGYSKEIWHRTGHSLGQEVHGNGANMDDYETHDDRRVLPGTGFTIEPGLYFDTFGVRTEINVVVEERDAVVTGPLQERLLRLVS